MSLRPIPRIVAKEYAKTRADLWLTFKFVSDLLTGLLDSQQRNIIKVLQGVKEIPARAQEVKKKAMEGVRQYGILSTISRSPSAEYKAALQRGIAKLSKDRNPASKERLAAYQSLASGSLGLEGLSQLQDEFDVLVKKIKELVAKVKTNREGKKGKVGLAGDQDAEDIAIEHAVAAWEEAKAEFLDDPFAEAYFLRSYLLHGGTDKWQIKSCQEGMNRLLVSDEQLKIDGIAGKKTKAAMNFLIEKAPSFAVAPERDDDDEEDEEDAMSSVGGTVAEAREAQALDTAARLYNDIKIDDMPEPFNIAYFLREYLTEGGSKDAALIQECQEQMNEALAHPITENGTLGRDTLLVMEALIGVADASSIAIVMSDEDREERNTELLEDIALFKPTQVKDKARIYGQLAFLKAENEGVDFAAAGAFALQAYLAHHGTGKKQIKRYQEEMNTALPSARSLEADGVAGEKTRSAMLELIASVPLEYHGVVA